MRAVGTSMELLGSYWPTHIQCIYVTTVRTDSLSTIHSRLAVTVQATGILREIIRGFQRRHSNLK